MEVYCLQDIYNVLVPKKFKCVIIYEFVFDILTIWVQRSIL